MIHSIGHYLARVVLPAVIFLGVCSNATNVDACPNCNASMSEDADTQAAKLGRGYSWSVLIMLAVPFTMVAAMGGAAYIAIKRSDHGNIGVSESSAASGHDGPPTEPADGADPTDVSH